MANIASQKKRNARTLREHDENRRLTSAVKTHFKRLEAAVAAGDEAAIEAEHRGALLADRHGGRQGRAAPQLRRPQEGSRGAASRRRRGLTQRPAARRTASVSATRSG